MTEQEKQEKQENFIEWVTFIEDRVEEWKTHEGKDLMDKLDWSAESLKPVESYLISKYTLETVGDEKNKFEIDAIASYVGQTLRKNIPGSNWKIELEIENSAFFNQPAIMVPIGAPFIPYHLVKRALHKQTGQLFLDLLNVRLAAIEEIK